MKTECFIHMAGNEIAEKSKPVIRKLFASLPDGRFRITAQSQNRRTLSQNDYMHVLFTLLQKALYNEGYREIITMSRAKSFFKRMFLEYDVKNENTGEVLTLVKDTHELPKEEAAEFIDAIIQYAAEYLSVVVPTVEEYRANPDRYDMYSIATVNH